MLNSTNTEWAPADLLYTRHWARHHKFEWVRYGFSGKEAQEGGNICIFMADSHCCMVETNTTLYSNYAAIRNKLKKERKIWFLQLGRTSHHSFTPRAWGGGSWVPVWVLGGVRLVSLRFCPRCYLLADAPLWSLLPHCSPESRHSCLGAVVPVHW